MRAIICLRSMARMAESLRFRVAQIQITDRQKNSLSYIFGKRPGKAVLDFSRMIGALLILFGAALQIDLAWGIADIAQCILAFINIPVCIIIGGVAYRALQNYVAQRKAGKDPTYIASENGVKEDTDFWK